jgi:hypothetical protein
MNHYLVCIVIGVLFAAGFWSATERLKQLDSSLDSTNRIIIGVLGVAITAACGFLLFSGSDLGVVVGAYLALCVGQCVGYFTKVKS